MNNFISVISDQKNKRKLDLIINDVKRLKQQQQQHIELEQQEREEEENHEKCIEIMEYVFEWNIFNKCAICKKSLLEKCQIKQC